MVKPRLSFWQIWNMSFGFLGIQFGWTLQMNNISAIYEFLGEPLYNHNFDNVEQVTWEDDYMHGIPGLHKIRQKIELVKPNWPRLLGAFADKYAPLNNLWRHAIDGYYVSTALSAQEQQSVLQGITGPGLSAPA